jgi:hypothetical protein
MRPWSLARAAGLILVLGFVANFGGVLMFSLRQSAAGGWAATQSFFVTERLFIIAAVILTALGYVLLEGEFQGKDGCVLARIGASAYFFAATLIVTAELLGLNLGSDVREFGPLYVVIAFLAGASIGGALLRSRLLPTWIGWTAVIWSIGWLVILLLFSPIGIYFPVLHHVLPLVIGIALLTRRSVSPAPASDTAS